MSTVAVTMAGPMLATSGLTPALVCHHPMMLCTHTCTVNNGVTTLAGEQGTCHKGEPMLATSRVTPALSCHHPMMLCSQRCTVNSCVTILAGNAGNGSTKAGPMLLPERQPALVLFMPPRLTLQTEVCSSQYSRHTSAHGVAVCGREDHQD